MHRPRYILCSLQLHIDDILVGMTLKVNIDIRISIYFRDKERLQVFLPPGYKIDMLSLLITYTAIIEDCFDFPHLKLFMCVETSLWESDWFKWYNHTPVVKGWLELTGIDPQNNKLNQIICSMSIDLQYSWHVTVSGKWGGLDLYFLSDTI